MEKLIEKIMRECAADGEPVTREEATEMAEMEMKAKKNCKHYEQSDKPRKKSDKPKTVKVSDSKKALFSALNEFLTEFCQTNDAKVEVLTENKLFKVEFGGNVFKIDLIQRRNQKK